MGRWGGYAFLLNMKLIGKATYGGRGLHLRQNIETPGTDGKKWEYMADEGLYVVNQKRHAILKGVA